MFLPSLSRISTRSLPRCFAIGLCCLAVGLSAPGFALAEEPWTRAEQEAQREEIIHMFYANLAEYARLAAPDFSLRVGDFRHLRSEDLDSWAWLEVVSPPEGLVIDMKREVLYNDSLGAARTRFRPSLRFIDLPAGSQWDEAFGLTVEDVLARVTARDPNSALGRLEALTSFEIEAQLAGQTRIYRAAMAWPALPTTIGKAEALPIDYVTQGVENASREVHPAWVDPEFMSRKAERSVMAGRATTKTKKCQVESSLKREFLADTSTQDHIIGGHGAYAALEIECSCDASCNNSCRAYPESTLCEESGGLTIDSCHRMFETSEQSALTLYDESPTCATGFLCAMKNCFLCLCSAPISIEKHNESGWSVKLSFDSGDASWSAKFPYSRTCPPCKPELEAPVLLGPGGDPVSGDGGNGNGGSGSSSGSGDGGSGSSGGGSNGGGSSASFPVTCNGVEVGHASSLDEAIAMCTIDGSGGDGSGPPSGDGDEGGPLLCPPDCPDIVT